MKVEIFVRIFPKSCKLVCCPTFTSCNLRVQNALIVGNYLFHFHPGLHNLGKFTKESSTSRDYMKSYTGMETNC